MMPEMPNKLLLLAAERPALKQFITRRHLTRRVAERFVAGDLLADGLRAATALNKAGIGGILDYLGENVSTEAQADDAARAYLESLQAISAAGLDAHVSVKLTQLGLDQDFDSCHRRMEKILAKAAEVSTVVAIDMESHIYTDATIDTYRRLRSGHDNVVLCLQAYLKRTPRDVASLSHLQPAIRLCKGAYNEHWRIAYRATGTMRCYESVLKTLVEASPYTAVATHDDRLIEASTRYPKDRIEFQMLYGVRRDLQSQLAAEGWKVRVYIPFGSEWYPYLVRRLAERPANLRFFVEALLRG